MQLHINYHVIIAVLEFKAYFFSLFWSEGVGVFNKKGLSAKYRAQQYEKIFARLRSLRGALAALVHIGGVWGAPFFCYYGNATPAHQPGRGTEVPNCKLSLRVCVCVCICFVRVCMYECCYYPNIMQGDWCV